MKNPVQKQQKKSRNGLHKQGRVRMGLYTSPFRKAVAVFVAKKLSMTMTDVVWYGIEGIAKAHNILDGDGNVRDEFKQAIELETEIVKQCEVNG